MKRKLKTAWLKARYNWVLFRNALRTHGWKVAITGRYYLMPTDKDPTYEERLGNEFLRAYRAHPDQWRAFAQADGKVVLEPRLVDGEDGLKVEGCDEFEMDTLAKVIAQYPHRMIGGIGYTYDEPMPDVPMDTPLIAIYHHGSYDQVVPPGSTPKDTAKVMIQLAEGRIR